MHIKYDGFETDSERYKRYEKTAAKILAILAADKITCGETKAVLEFAGAYALDKTYCSSESVSE